VRFGLEHVRHAIARDPDTARRLEDATRRRAAALGDLGVPAPLLDALVVLAARGVDPRSLRRGHEAVRALLETLTQQREKRLVHAGFTVDDAARLSALHTPNLM
jgi:hypothetical protein